ncbi:MAG TPA: tetratricopeptide repeat protein, partial [Candidatus Altiarchaeales archaeon]|nr:tetratricopeptide repeat protein [Candidatus Altiarchaeales archaeon]HEX54692.1 tetratricopeptide repeat protein [Candidatus Altiarchaeales archaeon]
MDKFKILNTNKKNKKENTEKNIRNSFIYYRLGRIHHKNRNLREAILNYKKAIKLWENSIFLYWLARAYYECGNLTLALRMYNRSIQLDPKLIESYIGIGDILYELGDTQRAIRNYRKAIQLDPKNAKYYLALSKALADIGNLKEAIKFYNTAIKLDPGINGDGDIRKKIEEFGSNKDSEIEFSDDEEREMSLYELDGSADETRIPGQPMYPEFVLEKLRELSGLIVKAIERLVGIGLVKNIVRDVTHVHICFRYNWDEDYEKGWHDMLEKKRGAFLFHLYELEPENPNYANRNVRIDFDGDEISEPEILHMKDLDGNPIETISLSQIGLAEPEGFTAYITYDDKFSINGERFGIEWAKSYFVDNKYIEEIKRLNEEIQNNKNIENYKKIGDLYLRIKEYGSAIKFYERALELDPENAELYYLLGNCLFLEGAYGNALKAYRRALDIAEKERVRARNKKDISREREITYTIAELRRKIADTMLKEGSRPWVEIVGEYDRAIQEYERLPERRDAMKNMTLSQIAKDSRITTDVLENIGKEIGFDFVGGDVEIIKSAISKARELRQNRLKGIGIDEAVIRVYTAAFIVSENLGIGIRDALEITPTESMIENIKAEIRGIESEIEKIDVSLEKLSPRIPDLEFAGERKF